VPLTNTECDCGSSKLVTSCNIGCHNDSPYDLCDNARCYMVTPTLVVKEDIILKTHASIASVAYRDITELYKTPTFGYEESGFAFSHF